MKNSVRKLIVVLSVIFFSHVLSACVPTAKQRLEKCINGYALLETPRNFDGPGTIYLYRDGIEIPIASPEDCFPLEDVKITSGQAILPQCYEKDGFDLDFGLKYFKSEGIEAKLKAYSITKIKINFEDVTIEKLPYIRIEKHVENNKSNPKYIYCLKHIDKECFVMIDMLKGCLTYEFIKENGVGLNLSSSVLDELRVNLETEYHKESETKLKSTIPLYFGYKAIHLVSSISSEKTRGEKPIVQNVIVKAKKLTLDEIKKFKTKSE